MLAVAAKPPLVATNVTRPPVTGSPLYSTRPETSACSVEDPPQPAAASTRRQQDQDRPHAQAAGGPPAFGWGAWVARDGSRAIRAAHVPRRIHFLPRAGPSFTLVQVHDGWRGGVGAGEDLKTDRARAR